MEVSHGFHMKELPESEWFNWFSDDLSGNLWNLFDHRKFPIRWHTKFWYLGSVFIIWYAMFSNILSDSKPLW